MCLLQKDDNFFYLTKLARIVFEAIKILGSVYFVVKTTLKATTERKQLTAETKTRHNFSPTKGRQKAENTKHPIFVLTKIKTAIDFDCFRRSRQNMDINLRDKL